MRTPATWNRIERLLGGLIILGVIALCSLLTVRLEWPPDWMTTPQNIEYVAHIKVPASAHNFYGYAEGFQDTTTYYRFEIDPADLSPLMANSQDCPPVSPGDFPDTADADFHQAHPWWQPYAAWRPETKQLFVACGGRLGSREKYLLVDMTDPQTYRVYIYYFS
jgi:hypothetical protein